MAKQTDERIVPFEKKMDKTIANLESECGTIRAGRANPHVLDRTTVPWESSMIKEISKAIMTSDLGINPTTDGKTIRLLFPELTEERRKELVKEVKKKGEGAKVAIRNIRRDANDAFKKLAKEDVSEDQIKELEDKTQKMTDKYIKEVDQMIDVKSKEILKV